jgi:poly(3-hydroxyalkanoate) synthetase
MNTPDLINGSFECIGGILCWLNFLTLLKDKQVKGVSLLKKNLDFNIK